MSKNKVKDPPHLGFNPKEIELSVKQNNLALLALSQIESAFSRCTSTPNNKKLGLTMDISFTKYQNIAVQIDNDSGYISHNQESNSELLASGFGNRQIMSHINTIYISEDTLLEKPDLDILTSVGDSEEIGPSVSTESERFNELRGSVSDISNESAASNDIPKISPIIVREKYFNPDEDCDISVDSNVENNINVLNTSNTSETTSNNSSCNISKFEEKMNRSYSFTNFNESHKQIDDYTNISRPLSPELFSDEETAEEKQLDIYNSEENESKTYEGSLLLTSRDSLCLQKPWPKIMEERYHGLLFNRNKFSEEFEMLCMKYAARYIGCETQSTCTVFQQSLPSSPSKRKANRLRWAVKSPGRRLSHLARRRITFSSANLQASTNNTLNAHTRQVVMDSKRFQLLSRRRSPFKKSPRKTPNKSPRKSPRKKIRTPSSSTKKRLSQQLQAMSSQNSSIIPTSSRASATKRALFQSPDKKLGSNLSKSLFSSTSGMSNLSPFKKRTTAKCALFSSPSKKSVSRNDNKRKRTDSDDFNPPKLFRSISLQETGSNISNNKREILKVRSEMNISSQHAGELSAHHKKKLQWAVYEALRGQNIGINHPKFKQFASVLARVTRRFLPNLAANVPRPEGGTSERMLRIARQHIHAVMQGKSVDEIIQEYEMNRLKNMKPIGYVGLENTQNDIATAKNKENVFRDRLNTMSNEKIKMGLNRDELIKTTLSKGENRADRVRRMIKFDNENNSDIR
ncbi:hypothetical protein Trydic_g4322 [Trypoxylus dichotomus]